MRARLVVIVAMLGSLAMATGCGNPAGKPAFEFTPIPYTMIVGPGGTPVAIAEYNDSTISANEVIAVVRGDSVDGVKTQLSNIGFQVYQVIDTRQGPFVLLITVPLGSVPAAIDRIASFDGVMNADPSFARSLQQ